MSFSENSPIITYYPAYLAEGKIWYVTYYAFNPFTGKMQMKRIKINRIKSVTERRKYGRRLVNEINKKLAAGWNPFIGVKREKYFHSILSVIDAYKKSEYKDFEENTIRSYSSFLKRLSEYIEKIDKHMYCVSFSPEVATEYMLKIKQDPRVGSRTYNNYLDFYNIFFEWMKSYKYIPENPFKGIPKVSKRKIKKKRKMLTNEELKQLTEWLRENNPRFLAASMLMYYCFLRNHDLCYLTPAHFDLKRSLLFIKGDETKNDKDSYRVIPKALEKYLTVLDIENTPSNWYLFSTKSYKFEAGTERLNPRYFSKYWSDWVRPALDFPMHLQFYSLKDTGITNSMADGISPIFVQAQADHESLETTTKYAHIHTPEGFQQLRERSREI